MNAIAKMKLDPEQTMKLEQLYKVVSECDLKSWANSSVGQRVVDRQIDRQVDRQIDRQIDREIERQIDREIERYSQRVYQRDIELAEGHVH